MPPRFAPYLSFGRAGVLLTILFVTACGAPAVAVPPSAPPVAPVGASGALAPTPSATASPLSRAAAGSRLAPIGATAQVDDAAWLLADRLSSPAYTPDTTLALISGLARSGIAVYADTSTTTPELPTTFSSPLKLLDFQAHALAVGAWTDSAYTGAELDAVLPAVTDPADATVIPSTSEVLAGYVAAAETPGAALSRALMAGQNLMSPPTLRFPAVVLVLFASDLATGGGATAVTPNHNPMIAAPLMAEQAPSKITSTVAGASNTVCSDTANWINGTISSLFDSLKLATPDNLPGRIVVSIWNWLVTQGESFVQGLLSSVTDAVLGTVRSIAATIAAVAEQIASLVPYGLKVTASGDSGGATFMLGSDPLKGRYTVNVSAGDLPAWPAVLADCASVAQIALPDFQAKNVPLTWGPIQAPADPLLTPDASAVTNDATDANGQAVWSFTTSIDPGDSSQAQDNQVDAMPVSVHRPEVDSAREHLKDALLGSIPGLLQPFVGALFAPYISGLQDRLNKLLDVRGTGTAILVFHEKPKPTPTPVQTPGPSGASCGVVPGSYTGTTASASTISIDQGSFGGSVDTGGGAGTATLTVASDGSVTGTWDMRWNDVHDQTASANGVTFKYKRSTTADFTGGISGSTCNLLLTYTGTKVVSCVDSKSGDCSADPLPVGSAPAPGFGPPSSATGGNVTWVYNYPSSGDVNVVGSFTVAVALTSG